MATQYAALGGETIDLIGEIGYVQKVLSEDVPGVVSAAILGSPTYAVLHGVSVSGVDSASAMGVTTASSNASVSVDGVVSNSQVGDGTENTWSTISASSDGAWRPVIVR